MMSHEVVREQAGEHETKLKNKVIKAWEDLCNAKELEQKRVLARDYMFAKKEYDDFQRWMPHLWE